MNPLRRARPRLLLALVLSCFAPIAQSGPAAGDGARLAATLATGSEWAALVVLANEQRWLRPGESVGDCVLWRVGRSWAEFECNGMKRVLVLSTGAPGTVVTGPRVISAVLHGREVLEAMSNPQGFALGLELVPEGTGTSPDGWRVRRLGTGHMLYRLGLREDDLVLAVGGVPAGDPYALVKFLGQIPGLGAFTVDLMRAGDSLVLEVMPGAPSH